MKKEEKIYRPISCDFYDELELWAIRQTNCEILYRQEEEVIAIHDKIKTIQTAAGEEFLYLQSGKTIRLDNLISINGKALKNYC